MTIDGQHSAGMETLIYLLLEERLNLFQRLGVHLHAAGGYNHLLAPFAPSDHIY